jgi:hypothetical protein
MSVAFDGVDDYVNLDDILPFERTDTFSFSFWVRTVATADYYVILSKQGVGPPEGYDVELNGNRLCLNLVNTWTTDCIAVSSVAHINDGHWHHCVITYAGTSTAAGVHMYIDGAAAAFTIDYNNLTSTIITATDFCIGKRVLDGQYFPGNLFQVAVYNVELSLAEAQAIYNVGAPLNLTKLPTVVNLVGDWCQ